jgi:hypothetical protein
MNYNFSTKTINTMPMSEAALLLSQLVKRDSHRMQVLECLHQLNLPEGYIAAGFVRNMVWDHLHNKTNATPLNDIDIIYFDPDELNSEQFKSYQTTLKTMMPTVNWQVRNQALMHKRNNDLPYKNCIDAMSYWPEKETAVAIRQLTLGEFECIAAFGFHSLLNLQLTHNPKRNKLLFEQRIKEKRWLEHWPLLSVTLPLV